MCSMPKNTQFVHQWGTLHHHIEKYVLSAVKNTDDTDDILQEVFIKAYTHYHSLNDASKLKQWLYSIARNEVNAHFNAKKKTQQLPFDETEETPAFNSDFEKCIGSFINALPHKYSQAIQLTEIENLPQTELAKRLNISYSGAKTRVQRGREKLKELMQQCYYINHDSYGNIIDYTPKSNGYCAAYCN